MKSTRMFRIANKQNAKHVICLDLVKLQPTRDLKDSFHPLEQEDFLTDGRYNHILYNETYWSYLDMGNKELVAEAKAALGKDWPEELG